MRLADPDRTGKFAVEHWQAFGLEFIDQPLRQACACLELIHHNALDYQARIMVCFDLANIVHQGIQRLAREIVAVERNDATVGGDQRGLGENIVGRRRIEENFFVLFG